MSIFWNENYSGKYVLNYFFDMNRKQKIQKKLLIN